jgi:hypothetical protein
MSNAGGPWANRWMGTGRGRDSCNRHNTRRCLGCRHPTTDESRGAPSVHSRNPRGRRQSGRGPASLCTGKTRGLGSPLLHTHTHLSLRPSCFPGSAKDQSPESAVAAIVQWSSLVLRRFTSRSLCLLLPTVARKSTLAPFTDTDLLVPLLGRSETSRNRKECK